MYRRLGGHRARHGRRNVLLLALALSLVAAACHKLPPGMAQAATQRGFVRPTAMAFAPDGRLFVAEQRGTIQTFDDVADTTPTLFADLREQVHAHWDRGLLGIEVDQAWPDRPYVYAIYSYDAPVGQTAPVYGGTDDSDPCPSTGCPAQTRVVKLIADATPSLTGLQVLVSDVCRQFPMHDGGGIRQAPDGRLIVGLGDGAWPGMDHGQYAGNPCGDPDREGGSLRAQDARTEGDPLGLSGTLLAVDPDTGAHERLADGLRNPFRLALRPGTSEAWVGDVGNLKAEEVNRVPSDGTVRNFGWPCYEGLARQPEWDRGDLPICEALYAAESAGDPTGVTEAPSWLYCHEGTAPRCEEGEGAVSGTEFYEGGAYDPKYDGGLFVADYTRETITVAFPDANGIPDWQNTEVFADEVGHPVDLRTGPGGDLFFVDVWNESVNRIYVGTPEAPPDTSTDPKAIIDTPRGTEQLAVGGQVHFSGGGRSHTGELLPASALRWTLVLQHCTGETECHRHFHAEQSGVMSGSFTIPPHEGTWKVEVVLLVTHGTRSDRASVIVADQPTGADPG